MFRKGCFWGNSFSIVATWQQSAVGISFHAGVRATRSPPPESEAEAAGLTSHGRYYISNMLPFTPHVGIKRHLSTRHHRRLPGKLHGGFFFFLMDTPLTCPSSADTKTDCTVKDSCCLTEDKLTFPCPRPPLSSSYVFTSLTLTCSRQSFSLVG